MSITEIKFAHPAIIVEWRHDSFTRFLNAPLKSDLSYELGITKPDIFNKSFHFSVKVILTYQHQFNELVFKGITESNFELGYEKDAPTIEFLFKLIEKATNEFSEIFRDKVQNTNLRFHEVQQPTVNLLHTSLQAVINHWDSSAIRFKNNGGERLERFKNLPSIPEHKVYKDYNVTMEQMILRKLETGINISPDERKIFDELGTFYQELNNQLAVLDYTSFARKDFIDFKNYIHYAFNAPALITNQVTIDGELYRVVVNESVSGENKSITRTKYLTYPPLAIVKKNGKYNRANSPYSTILYLTESVDTALKEIRPPEKKIITVAVWAPEKTRSFTQYPIEHSEEAAGVNAQIAKGLNALKQLHLRMDPLMARYMHNYFTLLSREYSKTVVPENHLEYMLSAILSESIFDLENDNPDFNYECITYPSVGNGFFTRNLAIKPSVVEKDFKIVRAIEFTIVAAHYNNNPILTGNPASISVAEVEGWRETKNISNDGKITW